ncbi:GMC family oxidoreductase N-terminal domain-containing protein, partial [Mesorhizobium sp. M2E.F.Ca.ET.219.01.1.1]|uniref:GMC family oxidoreductase N-terminal domain-containing protein n=1 Tax=Mesorhizobium sp. M2E.F.Ca.ET.219.01.1.1 TaxID=2500530 RepID=UPI00109348BA
GKTRLHGSGGEWNVARPRLSWPILNTVQEAAKEFGIMPREDVNDGDNEGSGFFEVNQSRGVRWNTAKAFLRPALRRPNLRLVAKAHVEKVLFE